MAKLIWVQAAKNDGRVALFEKDDRHPGGEAFVAEKPVQVAITQVVEKKLKDGILKEVSAPENKEETPVHRTKEQVEEEIQKLRSGATTEQEEESEPFVPVRRGRPPKERE